MLDASVIVSLYSGITPRSLVHLGHRCAHLPLVKDMWFAGKQMLCWNGNLLVPWFMALRRFYCFVFLLVPFVCLDWMCFRYLVFMIKTYRLYRLADFLFKQLLQTCDVTTKLRRDQKCYYNLFGRIRKNVWGECAAFPPSTRLHCIRECALHSGMCPRPNCFGNPMPHEPGAWRGMLWHCF